MPVCRRRAWVGRSSVLCCGSREGACVAGIPEASPPPPRPEGRRDLMVGGWSRPQQGSGDLGPA